MDTLAKKISTTGLISTIRISIILIAGLMLPQQLYSQNIFYSTGNLDPTQPSSWNDDSTGNGNSVLNFNGPDTFIIKAGDSMTTSANWQLSDTASRIIIMPGAKLIALGDIRIAGTIEIRGGWVDIGANRLYPTTGTDPSLLMAGGTLVLGTLDNRTLPEFNKNNCNISGGTLVLNGDGNQVLMGQTDYHNLTFNSPKGTKTTTSAISNISGTISIIGNDTVDVENKAFGGSSTNFVMSGGRFITGGTGTRPTAGGAYSISGGTMEFTNSAGTAQSIRSPENYYNIVVSGNNVKGSSGFYSIVNNGTFTIAEGGKFFVTNQEIQPLGPNAHLVINGTLQTDDADGFSGNTDATVNPGVNISFGAGGTLEYGREGNQLITNADEYANLLISGSGTKKLDGNVRVNGNLNILSAALDTDSSNNYDIEIEGNWNNQGSFYPREGRVVLNGAEIQTLSGVTNFYQLELNNSSGAEITAGNSVNIHNLYTHSQGTLTTNGNLHLKANSTTTYGQISGFGNGDISGAVSMQMFIPGTTEDWRNFAVPLDTISFGQLGNQMTINLTGTSNRNVYTWSENSHSWSVVNTNGNMYGKAYNIFVFNPDSTMLTLSGSYKKSDMNYGTLTYNNSGTAKNDGWHLLPNPYPSSLDWNSFSLPNNMTNGYACWSPQTGNYATWDGSTGTNGADKNIPPMHAFWVNVSAATTTDFIAYGSGSSTTRAAGTNNLFGKKSETENLVRIKISAGKYADEAVVYYSSSIADESRQGMPKLKGLAEAPCIWTVKNGNNFAANGLSFKSFNQEIIPLGFVIDKSGSYSFQFDQENSSGNTEIWLEDRTKNIMWNIQKGDFNFEYTKGEAETGRFFLNYRFLNTGISREQAQPLDFYTFREAGQLRIYLNSSITDQNQLSIYDLQGRLLYRAVMGNGFHALPAGLSKGVIMLRAVSGSENRSIKAINY